MQILRDKAISLLARREHSRRELHRKLSQRSFASSEIETVLDELEDENLLSEERFVGSFIRMHRNRGEGPLKICAQLQKHGIDRNRILANENWQESLWQESAIAVRIKRFGEVIPQLAQQLQQQVRFLQQRGFTSDQIRAALKNSSR